VQCIGYVLSRHHILHGAASGPTAQLVTSTASLASTAAADDQFVCVARTGTTQELHVETTQEDSDTVATNTSSNTNNIRFLSASSTYTDGRMAVGGWGLYLTTTERNNLRSRLRPDLTAVGAI
jgi:hypothetical protein